jgi:cytochrome c-550 PedF
MKELKVFGATLVLLGGLLGASASALAHGDVTPQQVDTKGLPALGEEWRESNPYRGNPKAVEIGASGFNQNCARCHGIGAVSGGIAPDLRYQQLGQEGDEWFLYRMKNGAVRDGRVYMPKFAGVLSQEGLWAIRTYLESRHTDE